MSFKSGCPTFRWSGAHGRSLEFGVAVAANRADRFVAYTDQVDERDDAFVAVERARKGNGWARICRHGLQQTVYSGDLPPSVADVDVKGLTKGEFSCAVWCAGDAARDAVAVRDAVDAAAAMQSLLQGWTRFKNIITVDLAAGSVAYQQDDACIIFSLRSASPLQFVQDTGLPPSFVSVQLAQQIRQKQLRHITSVVLSASAACPIFDRRSMRAHYLQPPAPLAFALSPRALELASLQPWCRDNTQRAQLLCSCCPLSTLAFRLPRAVNRHDSQRVFERSATARIMKRCFGIFAWRRWIEGAL